MITRTERPAKDRAKNRITTPVRIVSATATGSVLTVTFDQAVALKGVPQYSVDVVGAEPLSAELTSPTVLALTFNASIAAATQVTIEPNDPSVRGSVGGFVADTTFPL